MVYIIFLILRYRDAQQDANGNHNHGGGGGYHAHSHSNSNGGAVVGVGGGGGMEHEQDNAEEARRLQERVKEVDLECLRYHNAANETQALLEVRTTYSAVGRECCCCSHGMLVYVVVVRGRWNRTD